MSRSVTSRNPERAERAERIKSATGNKDMKYKHIPQKPYCCVPACAQMILRRRGLSAPSQEDIAYDLGIILPPEYRNFLRRSYKGTRPKSGWGTRINLKRYSLAEFFKRRGYALREKYYSAKHFQSVEKFWRFLEHNLKIGNDQLICFNSPMLYHVSGSWGHASLIEKVNEKYVTLRDPNAKYKLSRKVALHDLFVSTINHYKGGVWVISKI